MAKVNVNVGTMPAGTKHKDMGEPLADGAHKLKIVKVTPDGGKEGPYKELEALYDDQFERDGEGVVVGLKSGAKKEKSRLELYKEHLAKEHGEVKKADELPTEFGERFYVHVEYPCGLVKEHQVKTVDELLPKVTSQLRGHYGVDTVEFTKVPESIEVGEEIEANVANAA